MRSAWRQEKTTFNQKAKLSTYRPKAARDRTRSPRRKTWPTLRSTVPGIPHALFRSFLLSAS